MAGKATGASGRSVSKAAPLEVVLDVAKLPKQGATISGDTVEVIERPSGGISLVMADGEGTGADAKATSIFVAHRAIEEIVDGTQDGMAARAVHDALFARRKGSARSSLVILSADIADRAVVVTRISDGPALIRTPEEIMVYEENMPLLGSREAQQPNIYTVRMEPGILAMAFTRGVFEAGTSRGGRWTIKDILTVVEEAIEQEVPSVARALLDAAVAADGGKPADDMAVVALAVVKGRKGEQTRSMTVRLPVG